MQTEESLSQRFHRFLRELDHSENLDEDSSIQGKKADFLVFDRKLIVEIKTLESDPSPKVDKIVEALRKRPEFPVFFGSREVGKVLGHFPDAEQIRQEIVDRATKQIIGALETADDQIAATREHFRLRRAEGVVYVLNDKIPLLDPNHVASAVARVLRKRKDRRFRYRNIAYVVAISEMHSLEGGLYEENLPIIEMKGPSSRRFSKAGKLVSQLSRDWSEFTGASAFFTGTMSGVNQLRFRARSASPEAPMTMKRHEFWRAQYRANRYLAPLTEDDFWKHMAAIFHRMTPHFLKNGKKLPEAEVRELMMRWTHCLEEGELRNLNMRRLDNYLDHSRF